MTNQMNDGMVMLAIGRLEGKMDMVLSSHKGHTDRLDSHDKRLDDIDGRVSKMEGKWVIVAAGITAVATAAVWVLQHIDVIKTVIGR